MEIHVMARVTFSSSIFAEQRMRTWIWSIVGFVLGSLLWFVFFGHLLAGTGWSSYKRDGIIILSTDLVLAFFAASFSDIVASFAVWYSLPFVLWAIVATFSLSNIKGVAFWWGFAAAVFGVGFAGANGGKISRHR
jgi:hypothetical protein